MIRVLWPSSVYEKAKRHSNDGIDVSLETEKSRHLRAGLQKDTVTVLPGGMRLNWCQYARNEHIIDHPVGSCCNWVREKRRRGRSRVAGTEYSPLRRARYPREREVVHHLRAVVVVRYGWARQESCTGGR